MKIKTIHLDDDHNPESVVAELTIEEAAQVAKWSGNPLAFQYQTDRTDGIYEALVTGVFNPYWSDGVDGYLRGES